MFLLECFSANNLLVMEMSPNYEKPASLSISVSQEPANFPWTSESGSQPNCVRNGKDPPNNLKEQMLSAHENYDCHN